MVRVGVAGCGYWGSKHVRVMASLAGVSEVVAIEPNEIRAKRISLQFPNVRMVQSLDGVLPQVDALVIATPARTHAELALQAIESGVSVMVEKPLATTSIDASKLCVAAADAGVTLMVGHTFEYNAAVVRLKQIIDSGELGELYYINTARLNLGLYQSDVNVMWDLAPHDISITNYLLGVEPTSVRAWGWRHANDHREDRATLHIDYGQLSAQVNVSWLSPNKVRQVTAVGSEKMAVYDDLNQDERLRVYDKGVVVEPGGGIGYPTQYRYGSILSPYIDFDEPLAVEDRHFLDCVSSGATPRSSGSSGLSVVRVLEAASRSMETGHATRLDPSIESLSL